MLVRAIDSCLAQPEIDEYLIIENASTEPMNEAYESIQKKVEALGKTIKIKYETKTISFSEGQNWGLENSKNNTVLLLNNDAYFLEADSLKDALKDLEPEEVGLVGFKILNTDKSINHFGLICPLYRINPEHYARGESFQNPDYLNTRENCSAVTAAAVLVKKSTIRFNTVYWYECEDTDFCFQHLKAGKKIRCNASCLIEHQESTSRSKKEIKHSPWELKKNKGKRYFEKKWRLLTLLLRIKDLKLSLKDTHIGKKTRTWLSQRIIYAIIGLSIWGIWKILK